MNAPAAGGLLRAATYLGDNTLPIMGDLVRYLSEATGTGVVVDRTAGRSTAAARREAPDLDLVWMCGYVTESLISTGRMSHAIVAAPVFAGHGGPVYHSVIVARTDGPPSLRAALDARLAVNEVESWSGFLGLKVHVERRLPGSWFADQTVTGSHRASIRTVAGRECDLASIDVTIWDHVVETEPEAVADLRIIDRTVDWPAPPFSLAAHLDLERRNKLRAALLAIGPSDIPSLDGIAPVTSDLYREVMPV